MGNDNLFPASSLYANTAFSSKNIEEIEERQRLLIDHLQNCISLGSLQSSKLPQDVLDVEGMSSSKVRHFLNNLCTLPGTSYLEIGVWKGSTFISALYKNRQTIRQAIAIDNWSQFGNVYNEFTTNTSKYLEKNRFQIFSNDSFTMNLNSISLPVNVYFYDGDHTPEAQELAFSLLQQVFDDVFIAVVDDWNAPPVYSGTYSAFKKLNYEILFEQVFPANFNGDRLNWWNGLYVAIIRKPL